MLSPITVSHTLTVHVGDQPPNSKSEQPIRPVVEIAAMRIQYDGADYFRLTDVARMCGIEPDGLRGIEDECKERTTDRGVMISEFMASAGHVINSMCLSLPIAGVETDVFSESATLATLDFYGFESREGNREIAVQYFRVLVRERVRSLRIALFLADPANMSGPVDPNAP